MNLVIYRMEMRRNLKSFLIWTTAMCGMLFLGMMFFPAINTGDLLEQIEPIFNTPMMKGILAVFGAELSTLGSLPGFYVTYNSFYNILLGCIFASILAGNLLAKEEADKTAEFLFSRPVSRLSIFISKAAVLFSYILFLSIAFFITSIVSMEAVKNDAHRRLEISTADKNFIIEHVRKHPDRIYEAFNIDDNSFSDYALSYASELISESGTELGELNLNMNDMNRLIEQAMADPDVFFNSVIDEPESYMHMFSMGPEQKDEFLDRVRAEQEEYRLMKESFYSSPDLFIQFFEKNPGQALKQFENKPGSMLAALQQLGLPEDFENRVFKKYSLQKVSVFCSYVFLLLCCIGSLVLFVSLMMKRGKSVIGVALGSVLFFYFLKSITGVAAGFSKIAELIGLLSPFSWIDTEISSLVYGFTLWRLIILIMVTVAAISAAGLRLCRKDILV